MIVKHNLRIMRRINLSSRYILVLLYVRVHVYHFSVSFIPEE